MSAKMIISLIIIAIFVTNARQLQDLGEMDPEKDILDNDSDLIGDFDEVTNSSPSSPTTTTIATSPPTPTSPLTSPTSGRPHRDIKICSDLTPNFVSTRSGVYQSLECNVKICDDTEYESDERVRFNQPLFDWNSGFGHIFLANGTCDYEKGHCWHSIDIDLRYFSHQMIDNGINELQFSCAVSDYFSDSNDNDIGWGFGSDYSTLKLFRGRGIDESCENDMQCGDRMFCLNSGRSEATVCQCSVDFLTGVQFVQVLDQKYNEWVCLPPLMVNDSCLYDQQCKAMDPNSVCALSASPDSDPTGKCQCVDGMVYTGTSCVPFSSEPTQKPTIIWWIFTDERGEGESSRRFWWLRAASYLIAILAIILPIAFIIIALFVLCYRRVTKNRSQVGPPPTRPSFPAPKLMINDFRGLKEKSDKYGLVLNDHLSEP